LELKNETAKRMKNRILFIFGVVLVVDKVNFSPVAKVKSRFGLVTLKAL